MFELTSDRLPHLMIGVIIYFIAMQLFSFISKVDRRKLVVAFFHPYCDGGGGGERVLWVMIHGLLSPLVKSRENPEVICSIPDKYHAEIVIYSGETHRTKEQILDNVEKKFGILFNEKQKASLRIVNIYTRFLLEAKWYPIATMIGQSLGSILVGIECVWRQHPDIFVDTMGAAFVYPFIRSMHATKVIAYVHYPIISSDMLKRVREQRPSYNNAGRIAQSVTVSSVKLWYYRLFAAMYRFCGYFADEVMVNSTWTRNHIEELWCLSPEDQRRARDSPLWYPRRLSLIFPPCNTTAIQQKQKRTFDASSDKEATLVPLYMKYRVIMSLGQFRPEKDHMLQLRAMEAFIQKTKILTQEKAGEKQSYDDVVLVMLGSTRHADDNALADQLQRYIDQSIFLQNRAFILRNQPYSVIEDYLQHSALGLHTMWNEHFGISVVEMIAAGLVTIAHNSGGPKSDIIKPGFNGYLATESEEYSELFVSCLSAENVEQMNALRIHAQESARRFSDEIFIANAVSEIDQVVNEVY